VARDWLQDMGAAILDEQIEIARVPAPPFQEQARAALLGSKLADCGIQPQIDDVGNLLAWHSGRAAAAPVIVAAHIDTVFEPGAPAAVRREGSRWVAPGIADNARGLAVALATLRALRHARVEPSHPLLFAFTVGEEGRGDLRGVKHLLSRGDSLRHAAAFIAIDGSGLRRIILHALGSRRFRATLRGPGGHSWTDWGRVNPANAVGNCIQRLARLHLPHEPRTTLTVARLGGGTSINAIPTEAWLELDIRSEGAEELERAEAALREALALALQAETERGEGSLSYDVQLIGERPAARLSPTHPLVQATERATRSVGAEPEHASSSTDANLPLALGIPAIAVGGGGESGDTHTEHEWFEDTDGAAGAVRLLEILAAVAAF
jgi:acetylornithine deacetylase/succinyl-diaminopimelate desuccinylase-like protein